MKGSKVFVCFAFIVFSSFAVYKSEDPETLNIETSKTNDEHYQQVEQAEIIEQAEQTEIIEQAEQTEIIKQAEQTEKKLEEINLEDLVELLKDLGISKELFDKKDLKAIIDSQNELGDSATQEEKQIIDELSSKLIDEAPESMNLEELRLYLSSQETSDLLDKLAKSKAPQTGGMDDLLKGLLGGNGGQGNEGLEKLFAGLKGLGGEGEEGKEGLEKLFAGLKGGEGEEGKEGLEKLFAGLKGLGGEGEEGKEGLEKLFAGLKGGEGEESKEGLEKLLAGLKGNLPNEENTAREYVNLDDSAQVVQENIETAHTEATIEKANEGDL